MTGYADDGVPAKSSAKHETNIDLTGKPPFQDSSNSLL